MADELKGKVIVLTGATGSIGSGVAKELAKAGACIALIDRHADKLADLIQELGGDTECYKGFPADLGDPESVDNLINHIIDAFTQFDGLVHTVGGFASGEQVHELPLDTLDKMFNLNTRVTFITAGKFAKHMLDTATQGSIAMVIARAGKKGGKGMSAYAASKAATTRIMESMSAELKDQGIRVNGVSPSIVDTAPNRNSMPNADFDKWVKPSQIGELMVFLMSDASKAITGTDIEISGRV